MGGQEEFRKDEEGEVRGAVVLDGLDWSKYVVLTRVRGIGWPFANYARSG